METNQFFRQEEQEVIQQNTINLTSKFIYQIAEVLRNIGTNRCLEKADAIEKKSFPSRSLHLRDLNLNSTDITAIASCLKVDHENGVSSLKSISFSYNVLLGDRGAIVLTKNLPNDISEIGLVNCGITDVGGIEILNWMKSASKLQMICIEQNNFSESLKLEYKKFSLLNPQVLVVL